MATTTTTTINFGSGATDASVFVAHSGVSAGSMVEAWIFPAATANNTADNHWVEDLTVMAGGIVPGSGFTIYAKANTGMAHGIYTIGWVAT